MARFMTSTSKSITPVSNPIALGIAIAATLVGIYARLNGLGTWPLSVDEYYITKSTMNILAKGFPFFDCGKSYTRGLLQQYVTAVPMVALDSPELAVRLYPAFFNFVGIGFAYLLARRLGGNLTAYLMLTLMSLSIWEIEFARFARMYAPFQALALVQTYLLVRVVFDDSIEDFKWMCFVAFLSIFTYEAAIFLSILLVVAIIQKKSLQTPFAIVATMVLIGITLAYMFVPISNMLTEPAPLPDEVASYLASQHSTGSGFLNTPDLNHLASLIDLPHWMLILVVLVGLIVAYSLKHVQSLSFIGVASWIATLICFSFSMIGLGLIIYLCSTLVLLSTEGRVQVRTFVLKVLAPTTLVMAVFWFIFLLIHFDFSLRSAAVLLLKYPNFLDPIFYLFTDTVPVLTAVLAIPIVAYCVLLVVKRMYDERFFFLVGVTALFVTGVAFVIPTHPETRYVFFIYPLVLALFCLSIVRFAELLTQSKRVFVAVPILTLLTFSVTEDFDIRHLMHINTSKINYRIGESEFFQRHIKHRRDNRTPAAFVNENIAEGDVVIIGQSALDFYLNRVDYRFKPLTRPNFVNHIVCGLDQDRWSNKPVLYKEEQIDELVGEAARSNVWIIDSIKAHVKWQEYEVALGADHWTRVLKIPPGSKISD